MMRSRFRSNRENLSADWLRLPKQRPRTAPIGLGTTSLPRLVLAPQSAAVAGAQEVTREGEREQSVRVRVLGPLTISGAKHERRGIRAAALELIAYLALCPNGSSRDEVLEAIWPNGDPKKTRHRLYQATRDARRLLGKQAISNAHDYYSLNRGQIEVDVDELEQRLRELHEEQLEDRNIGRLEDALKLFSGEPLAGSDYPWAAAETQHLRLVRTELWAELAERRLTVGQPQDALEASVRGIGGDPLNERLWRAALAAEGAMGMRDAVERRYDRLCKLLDDRLGLAPSNETRSLCRRLLGQA